MNATSASDTDDELADARCGCGPARRRAARRAAVSPVAMSHAGSTWFVGRLPPAGPGGVGEPGRRVDRVVDRRPAVGVAEDVDVDRGRSRRARRRSSLSQPPAGKFDRNTPRSGPGCGDQRGDELLALRAAHVDGDRPLALVHPGPEQAVAVGRLGPAVEVDAAADVVEADHVGAELGQRHAAERRGDERRSLDHPEPVERTHVRHLGLLAAGGQHLRHGRPLRHRAHDRRHGARVRRPRRPARRAARSSTPTSTPRR